MSNSRSVIEKLASIVAKQQRIITKLAQAQAQSAGQASEDVQSIVNNVLQQAVMSVGSKAKYEVTNTLLINQSGLLKVTVEYPMELLGGQEAQTVFKKTQELLTGKTLNGVQVSKVEISGLVV